MSDRITVVMMGATGAVGTEVVNALLQMNAVDRITLLGRRRLDDILSDKVEQHIVDALDPPTYETFVPGHNTAICTLGVGEPSRVSREQFTKIDKNAPMAFGEQCKKAGVGHFQLLSSVGVDPRSRSFFLRSKGELEEGLAALAFRRLSLFHPSMILTPTNRYGVMQGLTLAVWPLLEPILFGPMRKLRGIKVEKLGTAIAKNTISQGDDIEILEWDDIVSLAKADR